MKEDWALCPLFPPRTLAWKMSCSFFLLFTLPRAASLERREREGCLYLRSSNQYMSVYRRLTYHSSVIREAPYFQYARTGSIFHLLELHSHSIFVFFISPAFLFTSNPRRAPIFPQASRNPLSVTRQTSFQLRFSFDLICPTGRSSRTYPPLLSFLAVTSLSNVLAIFFAPTPMSRTTHLRRGSWQIDWQFCSRIVFDTFNHLRHFSRNIQLL